MSRRQFDVVVMAHVLEHVPDPVRAVGAVGRLLRPGGRFVCGVPNNGSVGRAWFGPAWEPLDVPRHLNFFAAASLAAVCRAAGLEVERTFFEGYTRQMTNGWIATERRIYDAVARHDPGAVAGYARNSRRRGWLLLARTALAGREAKYDSVGVVARKPVEPATRPGRAA